MGLLKTLAIGAVGYVLGARAGRERYESIKAGAQRVWDSNAVRDGRSKVRNQAADTFQQAQNLATEKFHEATGAVKDRVRHDEDEISVEPIDLTADGDK